MRVIHLAGPRVDAALVDLLHAEAGERVAEVRRDVRHQLLRVRRHCVTGGGGSEDFLGTGPLQDRAEGQARIGTLDRPASGERSW